MNWMISANGKMYDHASSFATFGFIDWRQRANYSVGDVVFIYCTKPIKRVMYKCEIVECYKSFNECVDDSKFWLDVEEYRKSQQGKYARLKLVEQVDSPYLDLKCLFDNGLKAAPQGPIKLSEKLYNYINKHFNDYYTNGFFQDVELTENYHEGHVIKTQVNRYERSSIARRKCVEHHGATCSICGMDFGEKYGELGEGFIHVHHLKPLHSIGKEYIVDYKNDLIPVCPNCHAMIHRVEGGESMRLRELKALLSTKE